MTAVGSNGDGKISVSASRAGDFVHLRVEDNGVGFRPEESKRLFEKFYRPGDEMRREGSGQGLGLYIVRSFIELERGRLKASSDGPGKGAVFEVWWPTAGNEAS